MPIDRSEVRRIARLARLHIPDTELDLLASDLERIVAYLDGLKALDLPPDSEAQTYFDSNVHREDRGAGSRGRADALRNAPESDGSFFLVPPIVEKEDS